MLDAILIGIAMAVAVLAAGRLYQRLGTARDLKKHPAPGRYVETGGQRWHVLERGEGSPTVVFESGLMTTVMSWRETQPQIAKTTRTFCYDRAGLGWSDPGQEPRDAACIVTELHGLLEAAAIPSPYVLVGHSFAGLTTRLFAGRYADEVAGLVLIDPVVPSEWHPVSEHNQKRIRVGARILRRAAGLSRWGVLRFVAFLLQSGVKPLAEPLVRLMSRGAPKGDGTSKSPLFWNLPPSERDMASVFWVQPKFTETVASQLENLPASAAQLEASGSDFGDKPVIVISAGNTPVARQEEQSAIARKARAGTHQTAQRSGHWVMVDEPELVRDAILEIVDSVRRQKSVGATAR